MTISSLSIRSIALAAGLLALGASAQANMTVGTNALVADSVQQFSDESLLAFDLYATTIKGLGNTSVPANSIGAFSFPITSITVDSKLNIVSGDAKGSALEIARDNKGTKVGVTLANFTINYVTKQVLADTTPVGGVTVKQQPLYNFNTATPLALKFALPLKITGHEVLDTLFLTPVSIDTMMTSLVLPAFARNVLENLDFGTLTQDIAVKFRAKAVSNKPYVAQ